MENNGGKHSGFFSKKLRAGKRRTYFFDVRNTKQGDFYLTITESKKRFDGEGQEMHKIFLYKEDFKKFVEALNETLDHVKTELMPDFDYESDRTTRVERDETSALESEENSYQVVDSKPAQTEASEPEGDYKSSSGIKDDEIMNW